MTRKRDTLPLVKSLSIALFSGGGHDPAGQCSYLAAFLFVGCYSACPFPRRKKEHRDLTSFATVAGAGSGLSASMVFPRLPGLGVLVAVCWLLWCLGWIPYASWSKRAGFKGLLCYPAWWLLLLAYFAVCAGSPARHGASGLGSHGYCANLLGGSCRFGCLMFELVPERVVGRAG